MLDRYPVSGLIPTTSKCILPLCHCVPVQDTSTIFFQYLPTLWCVSCKCFLDVNRFEVRKLYVTMDKR